MPLGSKILKLLYIRPIRLLFYTIIRLRERIQYTHILVTSTKYVCLEQNSNYIGYLYMCVCRWLLDYLALFTTKEGGHQKAPFPHGSVYEKINIPLHVNMIWSWKWWAGLLGYYQTVETTPVEVEDIVSDCGETNYLNPPNDIHIIFRWRIWKIRSYKMTQVVQRPTGYILANVTPWLFHHSDIPGTMFQGCSTLWISC